MKKNGSTSLQLLSLGAAGYLIKYEVPDTIVEAVRGVARGETGWISRKVAANSARSCKRSRKAAKLLPPREVDVLRWWYR